MNYIRGEQTDMSAENASLNTMSCSANIAACGGILFSDQFWQIEAGFGLVQRNFSVTSVWTVEGTDFVFKIELNVSGILSSIFYFLS